MKIHWWSISPCTCSFDLLTHDAAINPLVHDTAGPLTSTSTCVGHETFILQWHLWFPLEQLRQPASIYKCGTHDYLGILRHLGRVGTRTRIDYLHRDSPTEVRLPQQMDINLWANIISNAKRVDVSDVNIFYALKLISIALPTYSQRLRTTTLHLACLSSHKVDLIAAHNLPEHTSFH